MNKFGKAVSGTVLMGTAFVGMEAYRNSVVDDFHGKKMECYQELPVEKAVGCVETVGQSNYSLLGIAEFAVVVGGIAFGLQAYRAVREDE